MRECPEACGLCSRICMDHHHECAARAKAGRCQEERAKMMQDCPGSCGLCHGLELEYNDTPCVDADECAEWARAGEPPFDCRMGSKCVPTAASVPIALPAHGRRSMRR